MKTASMRFKEDLTMALMESGYGLKNKTMNIRVTQNETSIFNDLSGATGIKRAALISAATTHYSNILDGDSVASELNNYKIQRQNSHDVKDSSIGIRVSEDDIDKLNRVAAVLGVTRASAVVMIIYKLHDSFCLAETHDYITEQNMI